MKYYLFLISTILLFSCKKKDTTDPNQKCILNCTEQAIIPDLRGFSDKETETIIVRTYKPDSSFTMPEEEKIYTATTGNVDSLKKHLLIRSKYDYELVLPGVDTFRIYGMTSTPTTLEVTCSRHWNYGHCFYHIEQVLVNDTLTNIYGGEYNSTILIYKN